MRANVSELVMRPIAVAAIPNPARFQLGQVVATRAAIDTLDSVDMAMALARHAMGDWGEVDPEDRGANDAALKHGDRLLSVYRDSRGTTFWIITEHDRSVTTILLPEDY